jgi:hypothetical protein
MAAIAPGIEIVLTRRARRRHPPPTALTLHIDQQSSQGKPSLCLGITE